MAPPKCKSKRVSPLQSTVLATPEDTPPPTVPLTNTRLVAAPPLFHAEVDVELTAGPILNIIADMAAQAIQGLQTKASKSDSKRSRNFDWINLAKQAITEAEITAKDAIINYVGSAAQSAWEEGRSADEVERGSPVVTLAGENQDTPSENTEPRILASIEEEPAESGEIELVGAEPGLLQKTCYCGEGENGHQMYGCDAGDLCRHEWYHEACLVRALYKKHLPKTDADESWLCPYCGSYTVKASMVPFKKA